MIAKLSDEEFHLFLKGKVRQETLLTVEIIELLAESEERKLYLKKSFESLLEYCVKDLGYSLFSGREAPVDKGN